MENRILGLHHITAIAGDPQRNYDFYTKTLGLRLVKKTVNFDDPGTYHFYFGDEVGSPGTILTFFPWPRVRKGVNGAGMATEIGYAVAEGSLEYWQQRFDALGVPYQPVVTRFGESHLVFEDPDGLELSLIGTKNDNRKGYTAGSIGAGDAIKGFHTITLLVKESAPTAAVLTNIFGYELVATEGNRQRFRVTSVDTAAYVDLLEDANATEGINAGGTNHHVAFRVKDEATLMAIREKVVASGLLITEKINRDYFYSLYFREPNGILFEIATDNPGFATDETIETLGTALRLPQRYEQSREQIERHLPKLIH